MSKVDVPKPPKLYYIKRTQRKLQLSFSQGLACSQNKNNTLLEKNYETLTFVLNVLDTGEWSQIEIIRENIKCNGMGQKRKKKFKNIKKGNQKS